MHLRLFDHPRHRLEEHPHSCLGLKNVSRVNNVQTKISEQKQRRKIFNYREIRVKMSQLSLCPSQSLDGSLKPFKQGKQT